MLSFRVVWDLRVIFFFSCIVAGSIYGFVVVFFLVMIVLVLFQGVFGISFPLSNPKGMDFHSVSMICTGIFLLS